MSSMLVGDGIENVGNAAALRDAAALFGWEITFHDRHDLASAWATENLQPLATITRETLASSCSPIVAVENAPGADDIFGFRAPPGPRLAVVVGNERKGIGRDVLDLADRTVQIPLASRRLNTLNVARPRRSCSAPSREAAAASSDCARIRTRAGPSS